MYGFSISSAHDSILLTDFDLMHLHKWAPREWVHIINRTCVEDRRKELSTSLI